MKRKKVWCKKVIVPTLAATFVVGIVTVSAQTNSFDWLSYSVQETIKAPQAENASDIWTGDRVYVGGVPWRVLKVGEKLLLLSENILQENIAFHNGGQAVLWKDSSIRSYLNGKDNQGGSGTFLNDRFTPEEQKAIAVSEIDTDGKKTQDKLFLLSVDEVNSAEYGFHNNQSRATQNGSQTSSWWWLRTAGYDGNDAANVYYDGSVDADGYPVGFAQGGLRPAMYLDMNQVFLPVRLENEQNPSQPSWRLFLKGENQNFSAKAVSKTENTVELEFSNIEGGYQTVFVVYTDAQGVILSQERVATSSTKASVALPEGTHSITVFAGVMEENGFSSGVASNAIQIAVNEITEVPPENEQSSSSSEQSSSSSEQSSSSSEQSSSSSEQSSSSSEQSSSSSEQSSSSSEQSSSGSEQSSSSSEQSSSSSEQSSSSSEQSSSSTEQSGSNIEQSDSESTIQN